MIILFLLLLITNIKIYYDRSSNHVMCYDEIYSFYYYVKIYF
jgi:hypothetical protein